MVLHILRALFILLMAAVGWSYVRNADQPLGDFTWLAMAAALCVAVLVVAIDVLSPRRKVAILSGTFLGLIVGITVAYALSFVVQLVVDQYIPSISSTAANYLNTRIDAGTRYADLITRFVNLLVGITTCYLSISFILQTKDDFRFIVPYVEFSKQTKGARPILLDTSVLIDGRIGDMANSGIFESQLVVPKFVVQELQTIADSADKLKRNRGRRGLDVVASLQANRRVEVILYDSHRDDQGPLEVDERLLNLARELGGRVLTNDFNLNKVAQLRGVDVININDLASSLKPVVLPGEKMKVRPVKPGEEPGQGVGYLPDGTMVVVDQGKSYLNEEVEVTVTSVLQTSAGRMIFGRVGDAPPTPSRRPPRSSTSRPGEDR